MPRFEDLDTSFLTSGIRYKAERAELDPAYPGSTSLLLNVARSDSNDDFLYLSAVELLVNMPDQRTPIPEPVSTTTPIPAVSGNAIDGVQQAAQDQVAAWSIDSPQFPTLAGLLSVLLVFGLIYFVRRTLDWDD
jgi:hypothetical protein